MTGPGGGAQSADERLTAVYAVVAQRRLGYDQMAWQTPALSFTALAFLFSIALGTHVVEAARLLSASLALVVSLLSIQLLRKHRHMELVDSLILERIEEKLEIVALADLEQPPHTEADRRGQGLQLGDGRPVSPGPLSRLHSNRYWTGGLALFALGSIAVIVVTLASPSLLP